MARNSSWRTRRAPLNDELSSIAATRSRRLDAHLINGVWLHPTTVTAITELEQWYDLEFRIPTPSPHEGWPR
jgi:hypothetical protein